LSKLSKSGIDIKNNKTGSIIATILAKQSIIIIIRIIIAEQSTIYAFSTNKSTNCYPNFLTPSTKNHHVETEENHRRKTS
jgi:hypothetical protein